jgi:hypothetical protein
MAEHTILELEERAKAVHALFVLRIYSRFGPSKTENPQIIHINAALKIYGQFVVVWAAPRQAAIDISARYASVQFRKGLRIRPTPGGTGKHVLEFPAKEATIERVIKEGTDRDILLCPLFVVDRVAPMVRYSPVFRLAPPKTDKDLGIFMIDGPGIGIANSPDNGEHLFRGRFQTWLHATHWQEGPPSTRYLLAGVFTWAFTREFNVKENGDLNPNFIRVEPFMWKQYHKHLPEYMFIYKRLLEGVEPIDGETQKSTWLPWPE